MIYHKELGFPESLVIPNRVVRLSYSKHALNRKLDHKLPLLPKWVRVNPEVVKEVHTEDGINIQRCLVTISYTRNLNMALVIAPDFTRNKAKVVTVWTNYKKDKHSLNTKKYDLP